ncbi:hypothetical protein SLS59_007619 [Nothophoma quercina]|uniref:Uncharacterized protein n=1 Tax=Nothophoma quercina TaxID=749835 RepID=A0ABR3QXZ0_9PLEO
MPSPAAGTPRVGTPGSVVRRRPVGITITPTLVKNAEKGKGKKIGHQKEEVESAAEASTGRKRVLKSKPKPKMREATPSDDSSNDDFAPDPGSPTANKRRRTKVFQENDGDSDTRSPLVKSADDTEVSAKPPRGEVPPANKPPSDMTTDELLAHHGVNTPANPYKAHIMSRHEPVVSNPVIQIPEAVKRGFKPRPTAEEIQKNIQGKVRHKLGLLLPEPRNAGDE